MSASQIDRALGGYREKSSEEQPRSWGAQGPAGSCGSGSSHAWSVRCGCDKSWPKARWPIEKMTNALGWAKFALDKTGKADKGR